MAPNSDEILAFALCPVSLFEDDYKVFVEDRTGLLADSAMALCSYPTGAAPCFRYSS
jgi:hypothetical protein